jgi:hypothetical protein
LSDADTSTNGASTGEGATSAAAQFAADRAAFIAMADGAEEKQGSRPAKSAPAEVVEKDEPVDDADPDADLDDEDQVEEIEAKGDEDEDPDADLDEDDKPEKVDPETAKRLQQIQRTDKRIREQREREWAAKERDFEQREAEIKPKLERLEKFERLLSRARFEPELLLAEAGVTSDEDMTHAFRRLYAMTEAGKKDPKTRAAVDQLAKERERDEELRKLAKKLEDKEAAEKKAAEEQEHRKAVESTLDRFAKAASDRYPLAKTFLEKNPARARADMEFVAGRLIQQHGRMPEAKEVMVAFEKERRQFLRDHGIDPKSRGAATSATNATSSAKTAPKVGEKKPAAPAKAKADEAKPLTKEDYVNGRFD